MCGRVGTVSIPCRCHWCTYLCFCCLRSTASRRWRRPASSQKNAHSVDGSAAHRGWLKERAGRQKTHTVMMTNTETKGGFSPSLHKNSLNQCNLLTSVDDCFPLVELAFVGQGVEVTALHVPEGGQVVRTWCDVTDLVPPSLSQTILPSVLRTVGWKTLCQSHLLTFRLKTLQHFGKQWRCFSYVWAGVWILCMCFALSNFIFCIIGLNRVSIMR